MAGRNYRRKKNTVDAKGRVSLPPMRVYPKVKEALDLKAQRVGLSPAYYLLRLVAIDLGYLSPTSDPDEIRKWLRADPEQLYFPVRSVAGEALLRLWRGADVRAVDVAKAAGLSYQQAYRQLSRDPGVRKTDLGWVPKQVDTE
jgi:hypothetical protein